VPGVRLAVADQHEGVKHTIVRVLGCPRQRCTMHYADLAVTPTRGEDRLQILALAA
jgi:hypothetical protein